MKYVIYLRVSKDEQDENHQRFECMKYLEKQNSPKYIEFVDHDVSATRIKFKKRLGLMAALEALQKDDVLLVVHEDRIARSVKEAALIEEILVAKKAKIVSISQMHLNGTGSSIFLMKGMSRLLAEYESKLIGERTKRALQSKKARGERVGKVPFGYYLAPDGIHFVPCPKEQETLALLRELRSQGLSYRGIAEYCEKNQIRPRKGNFGLRWIWGYLKNQVESNDLVPIR